MSGRDCQQQKMHFVVTYIPFYPLHSSFSNLIHVRFLFFSPETISHLTDSSNIWVDFTYVTQILKEKKSNTRKYFQMPIYVMIETVCHTCRNDIPRKIFDAIYVDKLQKNPAGADNPWHVLRTAERRTEGNKKFQLILPGLLCEGDDVKAYWHETVFIGFPTDFHWNTRYCVGRFMRFLCKCYFFGTLYTKIPENKTKYCNFYVQLGFSFGMHKLSSV